MNRQPLIDAVKAHALANYDIEGWDVVVETMSDLEIEEVIGTCRSVDTAIAVVREYMKPHAEYRAEIQAEIF